MNSEYWDEFASGRHFARRTESRPDTRVLDCDLRHTTSRPGAVVYVHTLRKVASNAHREAAGCLNRSYV